MTGPKTVEQLRAEIAYYTNERDTSLSRERVARAAKAIARRERELAKALARRDLVRARARRGVLP